MGTWRGIWLGMAPEDRVEVGIGSGIRIAVIESRRHYLHRMGLCRPTTLTAAGVNGTGDKCLAKKLDPTVMTDPDTRKEAGTFEEEPRDRVSSFAEVQFLCSLVA